jgi:hypothetical protein
MRYKVVPINLILLYQKVRKMQGERYMRYKVVPIHIILLFQKSKENARFIRATRYS